MRPGVSLRRLSPSPAPGPWLAEIPVRGSLARVLHADWMSPARLLLLSFAVLIAVGTLGLRTLPGLYRGEPLSWVDALFTATSAVCVTGLIVVDTATHFSPLGQAFLLVLLQLGGLGILTFATVAILAMGRRLSLRHRTVVAQGADLVPDIDFRHVLRGVLTFTFVFEGVGAALLWVAWARPLGPGPALWAAIFHSVSAYCNAGFSIFSDSLVGFQESPGVLAVVMVLITVGGLGFLTLTELRAVLARRKNEPRRRVSLQTRVVVVTTIALLAAGWVAYTVLEWGGALGGMGPLHRVVNGLFMSVTARTAGFNTVDYGEVTPAAGMVTMLLMAVGGSPGSTAGGMKTTTFAVLILAVYARFRGRNEVALGGRAVTDEAVHRAQVLWVAGSVLMAVAMVVLSATELGDPSGRGGFLGMLFEAVSAFNTVGLSMGVTSEMGTAGKGVLIVLMYLGRVGPMAMAAALVPGTNGRKDVIRHAREDLIVG